MKPEMLSRLIKPSSLLEVVTLTEAEEVKEVVFVEEAHTLQEDVVFINRFLKVHLSQA